LAGWAVALSRQEAGYGCGGPGPGKTQLVQNLLRGAGAARILAGLTRADALRIEIPKWRFRVQTRLDDHLAALWMPTALDENKADLSGMTAQEHLFISRVQHQAMISVDEAGTEAAAATAVVTQTLSARISSVVLTADRPFFFIVHDIEAATPLFVGRVSDPTTSA
jgi:serpin B